MFASGSVLWFMGLCPDLAGKSAIIASEMLQRTYVSHCNYIYFNMS